MHRLIQTQSVISTRSEVAPRPMPPEISPPPDSEVIRDLVALLDEMIAHQRERALRAARCNHPKITPDDILQPQDYPALASDPAFSYEDGQTTGLMSARVALVARLREQLSR